MEPLPLSPNPVHSAQSYATNANLQSAVGKLKEHSVKVVNGLNFYHAELPALHQNKAFSKNFEQINELHQIAIQKMEKIQKGLEAENPNMQGKEIKDLKEDFKTMDKILEEFEKDVRVELIKINAQDFVDKKEPSFDSEDVYERGDLKNIENLAKTLVKGSWFEKAWAGFKALFFMSNALALEALFKTDDQMTRLNDPFKRSLTSVLRSQQLRSKPTEEVRS